MKKSGSKVSIESKTIAKSPVTPSKTRGNLTDTKNYKAPAAAAAAKDNKKKLVPVKVASKTAAPKAEEKVATVKK